MNIQDTKTLGELALSLTNEDGKKWLSQIRAEIVEVVDDGYGLANFFHVIDSENIVHYLPRDNGSGCAAGIWGGLPTFRKYQKEKAK